MPKLQIKTRQEVLRDLINAVVARTELTDVTDSSTVKHFLAAVAMEIAEVYYQFTNLANLFDIRRAAGSDLDERAKEILGGTVTRKEARRAVGQLSFSRAVATSAPVTIPRGTTVKTSEGVAVETTEDGTIAAGATSTIPLVSARAVDAGADGNVGAGTAVSFATKPQGVDAVTNPASFQGGRDRESDDELRARILGVVESLSRCTPEALENLVLGVEDPGGSGKQVLFSHIFEDPNVPGTAVLYVDDGTGNVREVSSVLGVPAGMQVDSITGPVGSTMTLNDADAAKSFDASMVGQYVAIAGSSGGANDGVFPITAVNSSDQLEYTNAAGVPEGAGASYVIGEALTLGLNGPPPDTAVGGEEFLNLDSYPVEPGTLSLFLVRGGAVSQLVLDTASGGDFDVRWTNGQVFLAGTAGPLQNGDVLIADYTYFTGVIAEAQKVVDGDPNDRLSYPGYRAAGVDVRVAQPNVVTQTVIARLSVLEGYERASVVSSAVGVVSDYINGLGIGADVIRNEIIEAIMGVPGVYDVSLVEPTGNVIVDDDELPRITTATITIT